MKLSEIKAALQDIEEQLPDGLDPEITVVDEYGYIHGLEKVELETTDFFSVHDPTTPIRTDYELYLEID